MESLAQQHLNFAGPAATGVFSVELATATGIFEVPETAWDGNAYDILKGFSAKEIYINIKIPQRLDGADSIEEMPPEAPAPRTRAHARIQRRGSGGCATDLLSPRCSFVRVSVA